MRSEVYDEPSPRPEVTEPDFLYEIGADSNSARGFEKAALSKIYDQSVGITYDEVRVTPERAVAPYRYVPGIRTYMDLGYISAQCRASQPDIYGKK
jgi:hypothetical protein